MATQEQNDKHARDQAKLKSQAAKAKNVAANVDRVKRLEGATQAKGDTTPGTTK